MPSPECTVRKVAPATLAPSGALVFATVAGVLRGSIELLRAQRCDTLDLAGVTAVDSAGLACVLAVLARAQQAGQALRVVNLPEDLLALARVSEVDALLA